MIDLKRITALIFFTAIFVFQLCFAQESKPYVVIYQMEIVELSEQISQKFDLKSVNFEKPGSALSFGVNYEPELLQLLVKIPFVEVEFEAGKSREKNLTSTRPWVSTVMNRTAKILVSHETLSLITGERTGSGLELQITPLKINPDGESVLTHIEFKGLFGPNSVNTEMWVPTSEFAPIMVVSQDLSDKTGILRASSNESVRYFAVYMKSILQANLPTSNIYAVGSLDKMADLLWEDSDIDRESHVQASVDFNEKEIGGSGGVSLWLTDSLHLDIEGAFFPVRFQGSIETRVLNEELRLGLKAFYSADTGFLIAGGISDHSQISDYLTLSASFYPIVFDVENLQLTQPSWSVDAEVNVENFSFTLGVACQQQTILLSGNATIAIYKSLALLFGGSYDFNGNYKIMIGFRYSF